MPLFQNVPVNTAKDWADEVKLFCKDSLKLTNHKFMKQDNIKQCVIETDQPLTQIKQTNRKKGSAFNNTIQHHTIPTPLYAITPHSLCNRAEHCAWHCMHHSATDRGKIECQADWRVE